MNKAVFLSVLSIVITLIIGFSATYFVVESRGHAIETTKEAPLDESEKAEEHLYPPPSLDDVPKDEKGELIKLGYLYATKTNTELDQYSGNTLTCASCHGNGGYDAPLDLVGVTKTYPMYNPRAGKVVSIEDRINGCFRRSMNGKPLPKDSKEMKAMVAFYEYISQNVPDGIKERPWAALKKSAADINNVDVQVGKEIYSKACISCHGKDGGQGTNLALWGNDSYNIGAGMTRLRTAAGFIQAYMPKAEMGGYAPGSLTEKEAMNIAAYINSLERPDFPDKIYDWPDGDAPDDAAYETLAGKKKAQNKQ